MEPRSYAGHAFYPSSAPFILPLRIPVPITPSILLLIYIKLYHVEKMTINETEAGIGPIFKNKFFIRFTLTPMTLMAMSEAI